MPKRPIFVKSPSFAEENKPCRRTSSLQVEDVKVYFVGRRRVLAPTRRGDASLLPCEFPHEHHTRISASSGLLCK
jgi:hypothetical protein